MQIEGRSRSSSYCFIDVQSCHLKLETCPPLQSTFCSHYLCCALSMDKVCIRSSCNMHASNYVYLAN